MARSRDTIVPFGRGRPSFRPAPTFGRPRRRRARPVLDWFRSARAFLLLVALVGLLTVSDGLGFGRSFSTLVDWFLGQTERTETVAVATPVVIDGVPRIIDGDTLDVAGRRIRLFGIDAPESAQPCTDGRGREYACGQRATSALAGYINRRAVACEPRDIDDYGRVVAVCRLEGEDLNGWLVAEGWAMAYRHFSTAYTAEERRARAARRGGPATSCPPGSGGRRGITGETAILLARAFDTTPEFWLNLQAHYDLEQARLQVTEERVRGAEGLSRELRRA